MAYERKVLLIAELGGACKKCGYSKCVQALEFHHNSGKKSEVSALLKRRYEYALAEARKCILLCANCHREEHWTMAKRMVPRRK